jgi:hypothetical protein
MYARALELEPQHQGALVNLGSLLVSLNNDTDTAQVCSNMSSNK